MSIARRRVIGPHRALENVLNLVATIEGSLGHSTQDPNVFVWTASVESILARIASNVTKRGTH